MLNGNDTEHVSGEALMRSSGEAALRAAPAVSPGPAGHREEHRAAPSLSGILLRCTEKQENDLAPASLCVNGSCETQWCTGSQRALFVLSAGHTSVPLSCKMQLRNQESLFLEVMLRL